ncbi:MAG TPA: 4Fe-4S dicluster domain-containing protein [Clostridia bacterium]|nr:4Fe-4S dicluster domain-containing protein [Clostridia bacterium]
MEKKAILVDIKRCVGCQSCEQACQRVHGFPEQHQAHLSDTALTVVEQHGEKFVRRMCLHCEDPACASACLVGALKKSSFGPVTYDAKKCMGCRYCMIACPQAVPKYEWSKLAPYVKKCDMCAERQAAGEKPACVEACPLDASTVGNREDILKEAWSRVRSDSSYVPRVYGVEEFGGTSVFYISDVAFEELGFVKPALGSQPLPTLSAAALGETPTVVLVGGSMLAALYWITQRRRDVALAESHTAQPKQTEKIDEGRS